MNRAWLAALVLLPALVVGEEFRFDIGQYEKKPYEFGGYLQASGEHQVLDRDAALYALNFPDQQPGSTQRYRAVAELGGMYRWERVSAHGLFHGEVVDDYAGTGHSGSVYEAYLAAQPAESWRLEAGKRSLRWGKGYAFSPVAFLERPRDPTDPELAREGFVMGVGSYVKSFAGDLQTLTVTTVILPASDEINEDFGAADDDVNLAGRVSLLYRDTDIDLLFRAGDSRPDALGVDFARNLATNLVIHGELAWFDDRRHRVLDESGQLVSRETDAFDLLFGLRYLTATETTWILEYYRNGAGYSADEMERFYALAREAADDPILAELARSVRAAGYAVPQPMRDYLYIKVSQKEPFGALYWSAGGTAIVNLDDGSASIIPEVVHTGIKDWELRGRLALTTGGTNTDFGERQNDWRLELRARWFF